MPATVLASDARNRSEQLRLGRDVLRQEAAALNALADGLSGEFCSAAELLFACRGNAIVSGIGKAGLIGQKLVATFASTGTRAHFLHPAEALHGDLGRVHEGDVVVILSFSGQSEEIVRLLPALSQVNTPIIAITGQPRSPLGTAAAVVLDIGALAEACPLGLAPSTSTTAMLALGDALALVVSRMRGFTAEDFARFHPGGSLGLKLAKVNDAMRPVAECRVADAGQSVREALVAQGRPGRRTGALMIVGDGGRLAGIFTDSDLARLLERKLDQAIDGPIGDVMTRSPTSVLAGSWLSDACEILARKKISELPVVDEVGCPVGLIDITDILAARPEGEQGVADDGPSLLKLVAPPHFRSRAKRSRSEQ